MEISELSTELITVIDLGETFYIILYPGPGKSVHELPWRWKARRL